MPGTRTAPAMTASATGRVMTMHLIDASGDPYSEPIPVPVAATAAQLEAIANQYALASNASLWGLSDSVERFGDADADNAVAAFRSGISSGINLLFKNAATKATQGTRVVAPIDTIMQGNQDIPIVTVDPLAALVTALLVVYTDMSLNSAQFTDRRERKNNPKIKI